jgi:hypothetical protein
MAKVGRNEPCPCGSGMKVKRCCGTEGVRRRLQRAAEAVEEAYGLPVHFPRLRARGAAFDAWASEAAARGLDDATVQAGIALLDPAEHARIVRECREEDTSAWPGIVEEVGDQHAAETALLAGAIVAAVVERIPPPALRIAFLERFPIEDAAEMVAYVVRPEDLWSILESALLDQELVRLDERLGDPEAFEQAFDGAVDDFARRHWSEWHEERLAELVARARALLPYDAFPKAAAAIEAACGEVERSPTVREALAVILLSRSLVRIDAARAAAEPLADAA